MSDLAFVPKGLLKLLGRGTKRWSEGHFDHIYTYQSGAKVEVIGGTGSGGATTHNDLTLRDAPDAHPLASITGLSSALSDLNTSLGATNNTLSTLSGSVTTLSGTVDGKVDKVTGKGLSTEDFTTAEKTKLAGLGGVVQDSRAFVLMTGISPAKWYTPTAKTATSAVVEPSAATSGTMTIYVYSKVVGSSTTTTIATLSVPAVAAGVPTTIDFTDAAIAANSQVWAECADLKSGGTVSVSVVMQ